MDHHNFEMRLHMKAGVAEGEIRFTDVHRLCDTLQELNTRISRLVTGHGGPGRSPDATARAAELRLTSIGEGSTLLGVRYGEPNTLPAADFSQFEDETHEKFMQIMAGLRDNNCPDWVTPAIAESTLKVADTFEIIANGVVISPSGGDSIGIVPFGVNRAPWRKIIAAFVTDEHVTVIGSLYSVNLKTRRFGIRDDVGNTIGLEDVQNLDTARELIGQRATATGLAIRGSRGELKAVRAAVVEPRVIPARWTAGQRRGSIVAELAKPGPDPHGVEGITPEDVDEFLAPVRG